MMNDQPTDPGSGAGAGAGAGAGLVARRGCAACERLARAGAGDGFVVARLRETVALLHKHQPYRGWCAVWLKDHVEHWHELPRDRQARVMDDVADVAGAIVRVCAPVRINYECLGNVVGHVHWHVIPRYARPIDPRPDATIWVRPEHELECGVDDAERERLVAALRAAITGGA